MNKIITISLMISWIICFQVRAADTLTIEPNNVDNTTFLNVIKADKGTHIYKLKRGGVYKVYGPDHFNIDFDVIIVGEPEPQHLRPALIVYIDAEEQDNPATIFRTEANLTLKNLYLTGVVSPDFNKSDGSYKRMMNFYSGYGLNNRLLVENCVCNYTNDWRGFFNFQAGSTAIFKNNFVLNMMREDGYKWAGFMVIGDDVDSVITYNNTFISCPFLFYQGEHPNHTVGYFDFQHNTVVNTAMCYYSYSYSLQLNCKNNIFYNTQFLGDILMVNDPWTSIDYIKRVDMEPHTMLRLDTINDAAYTDSMLNKLNISHRIVEYSNNCFYQSDAVKDIPQLFSADSSKQAMIYSANAKAMFNNNEKWPGLEFDTTTLWEVNPFFSQLNIDESILQQYAYKIYRDDNIVANFIFDPDNNPATFEWPLMGEHINLCYSNSSLLNASDKGFPLGDYYHWFESSVSNQPTSKCLERGSQISEIKKPVFNVYCTGDRIYCSVPFASELPVRLNIFNTSGKCVKSCTFSSNKSSYQISDKKQLNVGIYVAVLYSSQHGVLSNKFIID